MLKTRLLSGLLAMMLLVPLGTFAASAHSPSSEELPSDATASTESAQDGSAMSEETDIVTRDLLYDSATNKQFLTIQDRDGNTFYLVIDYDAPVNEEENQYKTYFLNPVDAADLAALAKEDPDTPPVCSCTEKCVPGHINLTCPVCSANMTECAGRESSPPETEPPETEPEVSAPADAESQNPAVLLGLLALIIGGGFFALKAFSKDKKASTMHHSDDYEEDDVPWETEDNSDDEETSEEPAQ